MENFQPTLTSLLLCEENMACFEDHHLLPKGEEIRQPGFVSGDDDEYIRKLLDRETAYAGLQSRDSSILRARFDGINYILKRSGVLGFTIQTAYTSVAYLDKFLSKRSFDAEKNPWAMRLLSMACLSLAAKMEEVSVVPPLPEFCIGDYSFESSVIQRMELMVLNELGWTMGFVTPYSFIDFFANKLFDHSAPGNSVVSRIEQVVLGATRDVKIMSHKPSVIAAAATLFVIDQGFTTDVLQLKIATLCSSHSLDIENIMSCYYQVQAMEVEGSSISNDLSLVEIPITEAYGITSSAKRKRLVFNQNDEQFDGVMMHDKKGKPT